LVRQWLMSYVGSSIGLCVRAVGWLASAKQIGLTQSQLDSWACQRLTSTDFVNFNLSASDRGVPTLYSVDEPLRSKLLPYCERVFHQQDLPDPRAVELRELVSRGILVQQGTRFHFASLIVANVFLRQRFSSRLHTPQFGNIGEFVRSLVAGMSPRQLALGLSFGKDGRPLESLYENEFYRVALEMIPQQYVVQCQVGKSFGSRGLLDLYVNSKFGFGVELLRQDNDLKEHRERFDKPSAPPKLNSKGKPDTQGIYYPLVEQGVIKHWAVVQFREYDKLENVSSGQFGRFDHVFRVCFAKGDFERMLIVYPDLSTETVTLAGDFVINRQS